MMKKLKFNNFFIKEINFIMKIEKKKKTKFTFKNKYSIKFIINLTKNI